jgi:hypothetical protein
VVSRTWPRQRTTLSRAGNSRTGRGQTPSESGTADSGRAIIRERFSAPSAIYTYNQRKYNRYFSGVIIGPTSGLGFEWMA